MRSAGGRLADAEGSEPCRQYLDVLGLCASWRSPPRLRQFCYARAPRSSRQAIPPLLSLRRSLVRHACIYVYVLAC